MLQVDLTNSLNWNRLGLWTLQATQRESGLYNPLPLVSAVAPSPLILVAGFVADAPSRWFTAGWVNPSVSVDPGSTAGGFNLGLLSGHRFPLNRYGLFQFPQFAGVTNYLYTFTPQPYFPQMTIEAWWYDGAVQTDVQQDLAAIKAQLGI
jgi:hypothetical protein